MLQFLAARWKLKKISVIHSKGHQKVKDTITLRNQKQTRGQTAAEGKLFEDMGCF